MIMATNGINIDNIPNTAKFKRGDIVVHVRSQKLYRIGFGPLDGLRLESTGGFAYSYQPYVYNWEQPQIWVRCQEEMEDGRFELVPERRVVVNERYIERP